MRRSVRARRAIGAAGTVATAGAIAIALAPGPASGALPATATLTAVDPESWVAADGTNVVTIAQGGTVTIGFPVGVELHNAAFVGAQPRSCTQTLGSSSEAVPPLPNPPQAAPWAGTCTFDSGIYDLICQVHPGMAATVTVANADGSLPVRPAPPPPPPPPPATSPPPPPAAPPPASGSAPGAPAVAARALSVASSQRGPVVRGSLQIARRGSSLDVEARATRARLGAPKRSGTRRIGRQRRNSVGGSRVSFAVAIDAGARRALVRSGRLPITLRVSVTPPSGRAFSATRRVTLRRR
jgi:plastocyanin